MTRLKVAHVATVDMTHRYLLLPQMKRMAAEGYDVYAISAPGPWTDDLANAGITFVPWKNATRSWDPRADVAALAELFGIFRRYRFDIVHTHNPKPGILGRVAARFSGVPCVVNTVHGFYTSPEDAPKRRRAILALERAAGWCSDAELYQSREDFEWSRRLSLVANHKARFLGNGIDVSRFRPDAVDDDNVREIRAQLGLSPEEVVVGTVGRLVAEKGYRELFEAAKIVRSEEPRARFLVVGQTDDAKADSITPDEIDDARSSGVTFAGWRDDVRDLLSCIDVFVLPSWREGVPRSAIEAAAMGKPLVVTDIRGCREVVRDGIEGTLVPPRDPDALARAIGRLLTDADLRTRFGTAARQRAVTHFDETRVEQTLLSTYEELSSRKGIDLGRTNVVIRRAHPNDGKALARLHRVALPTAFLPSLGDRFMARLYRALATDTQAVALVAEQDGKVVGLASGVASVSGFYRRFYRRHGIVAGLAALPKLIRPSFVKRAIETHRYSGEHADLPDSELLSIAVDSSCRVGGIGRRLATGVLEGLDELGAGDVKVVVSEANAGANDFYARIGFSYASQMSVHDEVASNVWVIPCRS